MSCVLSIAGHDPSGGAGVAADIRACAHLGVDCRSVVTVLTAQSHDDFLEIKPVTQKQIGKQLDAVLADGKVGAVKIGLLHSPNISRLISKKLNDLEAPIVLDPVFTSTSGGEMALPGLIESIKGDLFPIVELLTPNRMEAERLIGRKICNPEAAQKCCRALNGQKLKNVLLKGGHFSGERASDLLFTGREFHEISSKRLDRDFRGTGCAYSTLIACQLSTGKGLLDSVKTSKNVLYKAMEYTNSLSTSNRTLFFEATRQAGPHRNSGENNEYRNVHGHLAPHEGRHRNLH